MSTWIRSSLALALYGTAAAAQVRLPGVNLPALTSPLQNVTRPLDQDLATNQTLSSLRHDTVKHLISGNRRSIDVDPEGNPIVRSEVLALAPTAAALEGARAQDFEQLREQSIASMNMQIVVLRAPPGMSAQQALRKLRQMDPVGIYDYNHLYLGSGARGGRPTGTVRELQQAAPIDTPPAPARIGLVDSGVDSSHAAFKTSKIHSWGCDDHSVPAAHGTAVASLLIGRSGAFRGVQPTAELFAADVYCGRPTGGAVDTLAAAFGWLAQERVAVINVSLVGPKNLLLEQVVGHLSAAGFLIVAAVGNDGPAATPLYPASYPGVIGVTGVDARSHVLLEAARGPQVMFAAPGVDVAAADLAGGYSGVRGTSFAAPFVAALLAATLLAPDAGDAAASIDGLAAAAVHPGSPGRDLTYGFGVVGAAYRVDPKDLDHR